MRKGIESLFSLVPLHFFASEEDKQLKAQWFNDPRSCPANTVVSRHVHSLINFVQIAGRDVQSLAPVGWLTDNVIDFCLENLQLYIDNPTYRFISQNVQKVIMRDQSLVHVIKSIAKTAEEFGTLKRLYIVHHQIGHWVGIHVLFDSKTVEYHDPYWNIRSKTPGLPESHATQTLKYYVRFMRELFTTFYSEDFMTEEMKKWTFRDMQRSTSQQDNGYDCGLYVFKGFLDSSRNQNLSGIDKNFRKHILLSCLKGQIDFEEL